MPPPGNPHAGPDIVSPKMVGRAIGMVEGRLEDAGWQGLGVQEEGLQTPRMEEHIIADEQEPWSGAEGESSIEAGEELLLIIQVDNECAIRPANRYRVVRGSIVQ